MKPVLAKTILSDGRVVESGGPFVPVGGVATIEERLV
jgi:hypothetical protein